MNKERSAHVSNPAGKARRHKPMAVDIGRCAADAKISVRQLEPLGAYCMSGVAQWLACWAHNPKVRGSKPRSAIFDTPSSGEIESWRIRFSRQKHIGCDSGGNM